MKKSVKIALSLLLTISLILATTSVFANDFRPKNVTMNTANTQTIQDVGAKILGVIRVVGTIVAVAMVIILGIKYMMGSAEERAEYKKTLFPYFIGAILIFAATNLADMIYTWAQSI